MTRIQELEQQIARHADLYYNGEAEITDAVFDKLTDELRKLAPQSSVLAKVGATPSTLVWPEVKHVIHMGSQLKVNTIQECLDWMKSTGATEFCFSEKLDGSSLAIQYRKGKLVAGWSRGDGTTGSNITPNVLKMKVPMVADAEKVDFWCRAEVIMKKATFEEKYKGKTKNPRNAAAGIARRSDGEGCEDLGVVCYGVEGKEFDTEYDKFRWLEDMGFFVPAYGRVDADSIAEIYDFYIKKDREECPFEIDGLIIAVNDIKAQRALGMTDNRPKGQRALKFPAEEAETTIHSVTWQTGRTGRITPVAEIEPTDIGGVTISRVMLNNFGLLTERGYGIGCRAILRRANDVIPELTTVLVAGSPILPPNACPSCNGVTLLDGAHLKCLNKACSAQLLAHLLNFLRVLGVKGFGLSTIELLVDRGRLLSIVDFYRLQVQDFDSEKTGVKLLAEFAAKSKEMTLPVFIDSLGIPGVGQRLTELAMQKFPTFQDLRCATVGELINIPGIGPELATLLVEGLTEKNDLCVELLQHVTITAPKVFAPTGSKCKGFVVCFTGFRDESLEEFIALEGGTVASSMNKSVTHLIAKDTTGNSSKLVKARNAGVTVMSRAELEAMR